MNHRGTVGLLLLLLVATPAISRAGELESEFASLLEAYTAIWNTHDGDALATFFTEDADLIMGSLPRIDGRDAIGDWWGDYFARIDAARHGEFEVLSLREIAPGVQLANVQSRTFGEETRDELETRLARGTWLLVKRGDTLLIAAMRGLPAEGEHRVGPGTDR